MFDRRLIRLFITVVVCLLAAGAFGPGWAAAEAPDEASAERAEIEALRARYHGQIRQVEALESDAETASGSDLEALRAEAIGLRLAAAGSAREWIEAAIAAEAKGDEAAVDRREIAELIPRLNAGIERHYGLAKEKLAARMAMLDETAPEARPEAYQNARRADELVGRLLGVAVDQVELLQELEMAADPLMVPVLIGLGLDKFSMNPQAVPVVRSLIRQLSYREAAQIARQAAKLVTGRDVEEYLLERLAFLLAKTKINV